MGDFFNTGTVKSSVRKFTDFADRAAFDAIVTAILANPWGCTSYMSGTTSKPAIAQTKFAQSGKIAYQNNEAKVIGTITVRSPNAAGFDTIIADVLADTDLRTAMGGVPAHDSSEDSFSATFSCHSEDGEIYNVALTRNTMTVSSYTADSILSTIETWADAQPTLN